MEEVIKTKKGLFIRTDDEFGALVFSPYSGLFFAISKDYVTETLNFCNNKKCDLPNEITEKLSIGLSKQNERNFEIESHWLPNKEHFSDIEQLPDKNPIVINWLISNKCNFNCNYCYAGDVIDKEFEMMDADEIAKEILSLKPLAVVISGGEPLMEKQKIIDALNILGDKVGIIIDTNGFKYDEELTKLFKKHNIVVRISLDSLHNNLNNKIRPLRDKRQTCKFFIQLSKILRHIKRIGFQY